MRSTSKIETKEIGDARAALLRARRGLAQAQRDADEEEREATGTGPPSSALTDAADTQWVRVALLERRERDAVAAHARGDRRRARTQRWRRLLGLRPAPADPELLVTVHEATMSFLRQPGGHSTAEDMHPSALDPVQADLQDALARDALAKKNAERDIRDA